MYYVPYTDREGIELDASFIFHPKNSRDIRGISHKPYLRKQFLQLQCENLQKIYLNFECHFLPKICHIICGSKCCDCALQDTTSRGGPKTS